MKALSYNPPIRIRGNDKLESCGCLIPRKSKFTSRSLNNCTIQSVHRPVYQIKQFQRRLTKTPKVTLPQQLEKLGDQGTYRATRSWYMRTDLGGEKTNSETTILDPFANVEIKPPEYI